LRFLIDTNVISEPRRPQPDLHVLSWLNRTDTAQIFISALTIGELVRGATRAARRDPPYGLRLQQWIAEVETDYADRIVEVDREIATLWGKLDSARTIPVVDCLLAATALARDMTLVTRNIRDIVDTGARFLNPWDA
jgi:toxin FitB